MCFGWNFMRIGGPMYMRNNTNSKKHYAFRICPKLRLKIRDGSNIRLFRKALTPPFKRISLWAKRTLHELWHRLWALLQKAWTKRMHNAVPCGRLSVQQRLLPPRNERLCSKVSVLLKSPEVVSVLHIVAFLCTMYISKLFVFEFVVVVSLTEQLELCFIINAGFVYICSVTFATMLCCTLEFVQNKSSSHVPKCHRKCLCGSSHACK